MVTSDGNLRSVNFTQHSGTFSTGASAGRKLDASSDLLQAIVQVLDISINAASGQGQLDFQTTGNSRLNIDAGGDISFYEDTGTTAKLFWDASAESLGIGNTSPIAALDVTGTDAAGTLTSLGDTVTRAAAVIRGSTHANGYGLYVGYGNSTTDAQYIQSTRASGSTAFPLLLNPYGGNVGIGTSSPSSPLEVAGGSAYPTTKFSRDGGSAATQGYLTTGFSAIGYSGGTEC